MRGRTRQPIDVLIVGAGAAGVGMGIVLSALDGLRFRLLERDCVGASFARWPKEMRFISPSFTSNAFGLLDLNAVAMSTSPAYSLGCEHPTGLQYASYLQAVAAHFELPVRLGIDVRQIIPLGAEDGFEVVTPTKRLRCRFVIWAAGEFQYPNLYPFPGAERCVHNSKVATWKEVAGDDIIVIGGNESGMDAAFHLCQSGKRVIVLDRGQPWTTDEADPSGTLTPYTRRRMNRSLKTGRLELVGNAIVTKVAASSENDFIVHAEDGQCWKSSAPPILATGFQGSLRLIHDLFEWDDSGAVRLTEQDESTLAPGLFVTGPSIRHDKAVFCFIYKFRQRFAVVAQAIAQRLGLDMTPLDVYRQNGMFLDDLSCCAESCEC